MDLYSVLMCRYLIEKGARLDAVNNDGELAIDLADGTDMENLLSVVMKTQGARALMTSLKLVVQLTVI